MITISHAPSVNLLTSSIASAASVNTAPTPLMTARVRQPSVRFSRQCRTMPVCERVKPTNTPIANSGTSACVSPFETTSSTAAKTASTTTPYRCTCRAARRKNRCGRKLSVASSEASTGSPPNEVFAASASSTMVISWMA